MPELAKAQPEAAGIRSRIDARTAVEERRGMLGGGEWVSAILSKR
jgi:hypothetical protein